MTRLALWIVRAAAWLVPHDERSEWRREWMAEAQARQSGMRMLAFALGAPVHAAWLQKEQWRPDMVMADLRYGWRQLRGRPGMAAAAVLTLAIGIGATTAIFSVVYGVLLKPLPYREPDRLVQLWETNPLRDWTEANVAPGNMISWRERSHSFDSMAWYFGNDARGAGTSTLSLGGSGEPVRVTMMSVSTNFFSVLGASPALGRAFVDGEDVVGHQRVLVLSHAFWRRQFAADPSIINRSIILNGRDYLVAGVMPASFAYDNRPIDVWAPLAMDLAQQREVRRPHFLRVVARLKPGATLEQARADVTAIAKDLEREYPATNQQMGVGVGPLMDWFVGPSRQALIMFFGAVALLLLIACVNVANLFLSRMTERGREMSIRAALGANRLRLIRQLIAEAAVVCATGAACGVGLAALALRAFPRFAPAGMPRIDDVRINLVVAGFAVAMTALTTLMVGLMPAWQASRTDLRAGLGDGARTTSPAGRRMRQWLVGAEVGLAVVLLVGASLTIRSFIALISVPAGFPIDGLVSAKMSLPGIRYGDTGKSAQFFETLVSRLRQESGVTGAGAVSVLPLEGSSWTGNIYIEGRPEVRGLEIRHKTVTHGYLEALGIPLADGHPITPIDLANGQQPVVVNRALARLYFPDGDAVGRRITFSAPDGAKTQWATIVGVSANEPQGGLGSEAKPEVYEPEVLRDDSEMAVLVRSRMPPADALATLTRVVHGLDSQVAVYDARSMADTVSLSVSRERLAMSLSGVFALSALLLAAVGIFGVASHAVVARTREIGVRMAFGATRSSVTGLILRQELRAVWVGLIVGSGAAYACARLITTLLFKVTAGDIWSFAAGILLLVVTALCACLIPARRAVRLNPVEALRGE
jgi:putative ABC transport system permease protein